MLLTLVLTHHWYDQIQAGNKTSEYRAPTSYWEKRLSRHFDHVRFLRGYSKTGMTWEICAIEKTSEPNDLGLPEVFAIRLGKRLT